MNLNTCIHIIDYKETLATKEYEAIQGFLVARVCKGSLELSNQVRCRICQIVGSRLHACMYCAFIGCFEGCLQKHAKEEKHYFAAELTYGNVYCFRCKDYIYDEELEDIMEKYRQKSFEIYGHRPLPKWKPSREEVNLIQINGGIRECVSGLKGLVNFSKTTCYMNCIIQVFIHMPILKRYFLSDLHDSKKCREKCLTCEMSNVFQEFYEETSNSKVKLHKLFYFMLFRLEPEIEYTTVKPSQKDASEFYDHLMYGLEENLSREHKTMLHKILQGETGKIFYCQNDKPIPSKSTDFKADNFFQIMIYIEGEDCPKKLTEYLDQMYKKDPQEVADYQSRVCEKCGVKEQPLVQEKIIKLPFVLCFHAFRLPDHANMSKKIRSPLEFSDVIDMEPYLYEKNEQDGERYTFSLYGVVVHKVGLDPSLKTSTSEVSGHYYSYIRRGNNNWYLCNDEEVELIDKEEVFKEDDVFPDVSLLFYQKDEIVF